MSGTGTPPGVPWPPRATYRLQLNADFDLDAAAALVPYLDALGVSHLYASPFLAARKGSPHGYDIVDHNAINVDLGGSAALGRLSTRLREKRMGLVVDFVPNHMGVGRSDNAWWLDVLEWGRLSPFARYFDIDWQSAKPELRNKVLLPFLGSYYGEVLERGELRLELDRSDGSFSVHYHEHRFPVGPRHYPRILQLGVSDLRAASSRNGADALAEISEGFRSLPAGAVALHRREAMRAQAAALKHRLASLLHHDVAVAAAIEGALKVLNGRPGEANSFTALHRLLQVQAYRLAYWRVAADEINYRRFFDINDLAGLRVELPDLFDRVHRLVFRLIEQGQVHGLRIDHVDGLFDPASYCRRLADAAHRHAAGSQGRIYLVVEKILAHHEFLPEDWSIDGSTGYEFANQVGGLFIDPAAERAFDRLYRRLIARDTSFDEIAYASRKHVLEHLLASELQVLANELDRITELDWHTRDFTLNTLNDALKEVVACFPVYRSYVTGKGITPQDRRDIDWAVSQARKRSAGPSQVFDFIHAVLTTDFSRGTMRRRLRRRVIDFAMKFQQLTGPVAAKGLEDTAFYRYNRFVPLNEVGGDPRRFGTSVAAFHHANQERVRRWPQAMLATSTHDAKRGEDVRARLYALSELPDEWSRQVRRWIQLNRRAKTVVDDHLVPTVNDEYLLYQTLIGSWPFELGDSLPLPADALAHYVKRIQAYMIKAAREAKTHSSWAEPDETYEAALSRFIERILDPTRSASFLSGFLPFQVRIAQLGAVNGLAQTLLKLGSPGVPDIYQGAELWDLRLVDPDNRRPLDFSQCRHLLEQLPNLDVSDTQAAPIPGIEPIMRDWRSGQIKLYLIQRLLALRRQLPDLFASGDYMPLDTTGMWEGHVCAFVRYRDDNYAIFLAPRLIARLPGSGGGSPLGPASWGDTEIILPARWPDRPLHHLLTGQALSIRQFGEQRRLSVADLLASSPVACALSIGSMPVTP